MRAMTFVGAVLACVLASPLAAQEAKSSAELRELSDAQAERQAKRDLSSLLKDFSGYDVGNRLALGDVWFFTEARATPVTGLCERDIVSLYYHTAAHNPRDWANAPVRPYKIEAKRMFSFIETPTDESIAADKEREYKPLPWSRKCRAQTKEGWDGWFYADNESQAVQAYQALVAANEAATSGLVKVTGCEKNDDRGERCVETLKSALDPKWLSRVRRTIDSNATVTFWIDARSSWITIELKLRTPRTLAEDIKSVNVEEYIIVT